jgi:hypothetical protein
MAIMVKLGPADSVKSKIEEQSQRAQSVTQVLQYHGNQISRYRCGRS